jgi:hypothetical protein
MEVGHFYADTIAQGRDVLAEHFSAIHTVAQTAIRAWTIQKAQAYKQPVSAIRKPLVTTCFMFDDYHNRPAASTSPAEPLGLILDAAADANVQIDYVVREAAYAPMAEVVLTSLMREARVRATDEGSGWLLAEEPRTQYAMAMGYEERAPTRSPINISVELYSHPAGTKGRTSWACPFLASMWQIHRLGGVAGLPTPEPTQVLGELPNWKHWEDVPSVIQRNPDAAPFAAAETFSILPNAFTPVEGAVDRIIAALNMNAENPIVPARQMRYHFSHFG